MAPTGLSCAGSVRTPNDRPDRPHTTTGAAVPFLRLAVLALLFAATLSPPTEASTSPVDELFAMINDFREANGLPRLRRSPILDASAWHKSQDIAERGYFAHVTPEGQTPEQ